jgi:hypothetical protein
MGGVCGVQFFDTATLSMKHTLIDLIKATGDHLSDVGPREDLRIAKVAM